MGNIKMAIIGGSSGDVLVEASKKRGCYTIIICGDESNSGYGIADENYVIDLKEKEKIVNLIRKNADCLLMGTGHEYAHAIAKELYKEKFPISIDPIAASLGKDKEIAYSNVKRLGYFTPEHKLVRNETEFVEKNICEFPLPCVVKSQNDAVPTAKANNMVELNALLKEHFSKNSVAIVEEFLEGVQYTIPVVSDGIIIKPLDRALDMRDVNLISSGPLKNFNKEQASFFDINRVPSDSLRQEIVQMVTNITKEFGLIGVPRFDLMVKDGHVYFLEVNEVAASQTKGPKNYHYPLPEVGINMAEEMVDVMLKIYKEYKNA